MPNQITFGVIRGKVEKYKSDYGLDSNPLAFEWFLLESILGLNSDDIEDSITDGSHDGGIDAIYINERTVHFFTFEYTDKFENTNKNFPSKEIDQYLITLQGILDHTLTRSDVNPLVWEKANEIWDLLSTGSLVFRFYICSNKLKPVEQAQRKFESRLQPYRFVEFFYVDHDGIADRVIEQRYKKVDGNLKFVDRQYFDRSDGSIKGIVATVAASDLIAIVQDPNDPKKLNDDVLEMNVRRYKPKHRINIKMLESALSDDNYKFWYLNNGITIVCEECNYVPNTRSPSVELKNFQIVNGGQTTHTLFEANQRDSDKVSNILVLVRICVATKNNSIAEKISETTNSQIPVTTRDLHSNDRIQERLEEEFLSLGYFYERKPNSHDDEAIEKRLNNELLAQLYLSYYLDKPAEAKNQKSLVFGDMYEDIFDEDEISAKRLLLPYQIYLPLKVLKREIQKRKRNKQPINEQEAFVSRAIYHIVNAVGYIAEYEDLDLNNSVNIQKAIEKAINIIGEVVKREIKQRGKLYTHDKFFKEIGTSALIKERIEQKYVK